MNLLTPEMPEPDSECVFENWFFYWKTSPFLWAEKLRALHSSQVILPINWSLHAPRFDHIDFGEEIPEADLLKLCEIIFSLKKEPIFLLPITPTPAMINGGVPHFLARQILIDEQNLVVAFPNGKDELVKLYTFFDPRILKEFDRFCFKLAEYFQSYNFEVNLWAYESGFMSNGKFKSFFSDFSPVFYSAKSRYTEIKKVEISDVDYTSEIKTLYLLSVKEHLAAFYHGAMPIVFLGATPSDFINRLFNLDTNNTYSAQLFEAYHHQIMSSSALLHPDVKIKKQLKEVVENTLFPQHFVGDNLKESEIDFSALNLFYIIDGENYKNLFLDQFLQQEFGSTYQFLKFLPKLDGPLDGIFFFTGSLLTKEKFSFLLKLFLNRTPIVLDLNSIPQEFKERLAIFIIENHLKEEVINFYGEVRLVSLGESSMLLFNSAEMKVPSNQNLTSFYLQYWPKLISAIAPFHIKFKAHNKAVSNLWKTRSSFLSELKFSEVRRVHLFNPTSYRQKIILDLASKSVLYKVLDEVNVTVDSKPNMVDIEMAPNASVTIDFGVFA